MKLKSSNYATGAAFCTYPILHGILDHSPLIDQIANSTELDAPPISDEREAFVSGIGNPTSWDMTQIGRCCCEQRRDGPPRSPVFSLQRTF
jgi:hypothetical protein